MRAAVNNGLLTVAIVAATALVLGTTAPAQAQVRTKVVVYTALENDQLGPLKQALEVAHKDVEVSWVRDSTGVITARVLAEKANPQTDVVWGLALSSVLMFDKEGLLEPYTPQPLADLNPPFLTQPPSPPRPRLQ